MNELPEGWTEAKLGDFFSLDQLKHIAKVCDETNGDVFEAARRLRPYFESLREQLEPRGLLPEYAAYAVPFVIKKGQTE